MPRLSSSKFRFITKVSEFDRCIDEVVQYKCMGLDIESNSYFRYPERICLIQIAIPGQVFIVDSLRISDLTALGHILSDGSIEKVAHSASYDLWSFDRELGVRFSNLFDTSIAASFLGMWGAGLATLLDSLLGVKIIKNIRLQRSDWTVRPLSQLALAYAAGDVNSLLNLRQVLRGRLKELGREEWVIEECKRLADSVKYTPPDKEKAFLSVKGSSVLDERGLTILKSLTEFREGEAKRIGRPHFRIIPDQVLVQIATNPKDNLAKNSRLGKYSRPPFEKKLREALQDGLNRPVIQKPAVPEPRSRALTEKQKERLDILKDWRANWADILGLHPTLIWPSVSLERLAREPGIFEAEMLEPEVRQWQKDEFENTLRKTFLV